ncbi:MAG: enoyl-CoA hydratase/isomerase family protein [Bacteroidota bacterium]
MNIEKILEFETEDMKFYVHENIAVIRFKSDMYEKFSNLDTAEKILSMLDWVEQDPVVHALLIFNQPDSFDSDSFARFSEKIIIQKVEDGFSLGIESEKKMLRSRMMNNLRNYIMKMANYKKILISCIQGSVATPFFGAVLSNDFRFSTIDLKFALNHKKHKMHPIGALPFFLPKYVGQGKAAEILLQKNELNAEEALSLDLINGIFPFEDFENICIQRAKEICNYDSRIMYLSKTLVCDYVQELDNYFDKETKLVGN